MSIHGLSAPEVLILAGLLFLIFVLPRFRKKAHDEQRADTLSALGFVDASRDKVFEHPKALACLIYDNLVSSIGAVATGRSEMGETAIFEFTYDTDGASTQRFTVVAFRSGAELPDFRIEHALWGDRLLKGGHDADLGMPGSLATYDRHSHQWTHPDLEIPVMTRVAIEGHPAFAKDFFVWSSDADGLRRVLTPAAMSALCTLNDSSLTMTKRMGWLMVYHWHSNPAPASRYPALLQEAVQLVQKMDWPATAGGPAAVAGH